MNTLAGRRVLVTGADGFIGSHLVERLAGEGAHVRAFCLYTSHASLGSLADAPPETLARVEVLLGDIRDARRVEEAVRGVDVVFHLAALIAIPYSYEAPESFLDTNVRGTLHVLEAARRAGCARVVHTSTSEVYGTPETLPIRETHPLRAQSPYSASKIAADKLCEAYACSYGVPVVVLRPFNTYGPRQSARAVLPTMLLQLLRGAEAVQLGSLTPRRDLTYVADTVDGLVRAGAAETLTPGEVIQLGTGSAVSIGELFELACQATGRRARAVFDQRRARPDRSEVQVLQSEPGRAARLLGWSATTGLAEGIRRTAEWFERHQQRFPEATYQV